MQKLINLKVTIVVKTMILPVVILITALLADSFLYESGRINPSIFQELSACNNGVWLRYWWYRGKHSESDWQAMLKRLNEHKTRYAYFHVLGTKPDGHLEYHQLAEARKIVARVHASCPNTLCLAWVYVPSNFARKGVNLGNNEVRAALHQEADWLINECGFDGLQWDYEFAPNADSNFIKFLKESRERIPSSKNLSIATPMNYPGTLWGWSDKYFRESAPYVDQIAVMAYDSYLWVPRWYGSLVARQVKHVSENARAANENCTVIIGVPTYEDCTMAHQAFCESLANSLRGVEQGLREAQSQRQGLEEPKYIIEGIAPFADYTTDGDEWKLFDRTARKVEGDN